MGLKACLLVSILLAQSDEEKAVASFKGFQAAIKSGDHEKAADLIHPKSAAKIRDRVVASLDKSPAAVQERFLKTLGFKDVQAVKDAAPRDFFVSYLKNLKDLGEGPRQIMGAAEGAETTVIGTVKKDDKVYIIAESTFVVGSETHVTPVLQVAYKDGDAWKLAHRGETNIGK
jgi:hypothetical protein